MTSRRKLIPMIVAAPMFLQNIDMMAASVALPDMAATLHVRPLHLNLVIAAYAISLAAFLPLSAWLVDRFGAKRMFCTAIAIFAGASALCGLSQTATMLIGFRVLQGFAAALMVPVGRLILLRSVPPTELVAAMTWFTIPPAIGRLIGPLVGGVIVSLASWRWIFLVNIPLGTIALLLALLLLKGPAEENRAGPFDFVGFALMGLGLATTLGGLEVLGRQLIPWPWAIAVIVAGALMLAGYARHSLASERPVIDLRILKYQAFRTNVIGSLPLRVANVSAPFLAPLVLQLGLGYPPFKAGLVSSGLAVGSLATRAGMRFALKLFTFRNLFLISNACAAVFYAGYALIGPSVPPWAIFALLCAGGLVISLCLVALNTVGFVDVPDERRSHATALVAMAQQTTNALGVVTAAALLGLFSRWHGGDGTHPQLADFAATFVTLGALAAVSLWPFSKLHPDEGAALR